MREDALFLNSPTGKYLIMPFTVSHTVAVIPLRKYLGRFGALSALIIGSMTPDFAYLTPYLVHQRVDSHTLIGLFLYCIPMGLSVYLFFHWFIAPVVCSLLPRYIQNSLNPDLLLGRIPNLPVHIVLFGIIFGSITHIVWDFFTHSTGIPRYVGFMNIPMATIDGYDIMPYRVLQHLSTLLGLALLLFWIWRWVSKQKHKPLNHHQSRAISWQAPSSLKRLTILILLIIPAVVGLIITLLNIPDSNVLHGLHSFQLGLKKGVLAAAGSIFICCFVLGLYYQYLIRQKLSIQAN